MLVVKPVGLGGAMTVAPVAGRRVTEVLGLVVVEGARLDDAAKEAVDEPDEELEGELEDEVEEDGAAELLTLVPVLVPVLPPLLAGAADEDAAAVVVSAALVMGARGGELLLVSEEADIPELGAEREVDCEMGRHAGSESEVHPPPIDTWAQTATWN